MASFLVEVYAPGSAEGLKDAVARARSASRALSREGTAVRHVRAILVPEDKVCFHLFEGPSALVVGEASRRAGLRQVRIIEAVESGRLQEGGRR
jgi:hypothetical protein